MELDQVRRGVLKPAALIGGQSPISLPYDSTRHPVKKKSALTPIYEAHYCQGGLDYSVEQDWSAYTPEEHALYRRLFERQSKLVPRYACDEWIDAHRRGSIRRREIPRFDKVSRQLRAKPAGRSSPCPASSPTTPSSPTSPTGAFRSPCGCRRPEEFDYIVEPDVFHDFFATCRCFSTGPTPTTCTNTARAA